MAEEKVGDRLEPQRIACKMQPPELVVEFFHHGKGRLYLRRMKLGRMINDGTTPSSLYEELKKKYEVLLDPKNGLAQDQVERLLRKVIFSVRKQPDAPDGSAAGADDTSGGAAAASGGGGLVDEAIIKGEVDLCKLDDDTVKAYKDQQAAGFEANRVLPDDPSYTWDKKVEFSAPVEDSGWDSD